jgi:hypothetical protein
MTACQTVPVLGNVCRRVLGHAAGRRCVSRAMHAWFAHAICTNEMRDRRARPRFQAGGVALERARSATRCRGVAFAMWPAGCSTIECGSPHAGEQG